MRQLRPTVVTEQMILSFLSEKPGLYTNEVASMLGVGRDRARAVLADMASKQRGILRCLPGPHSGSEKKYYLPENAPAEATFSGRTRPQQQNYNGPTWICSVTGFNDSMLQQLLGYASANTTAQHLSERVPSSFVHECRL